MEVLIELWKSSGFVQMHWQNWIMILLGCFLIFLAVVKKFEPLLLLPIAFGMILVNLQGANLMADPSHGEAGGLLWYLSQGIDKEIYPPLIFLGVGAMTDFGPLLANPSSIFMGAGAQFGVFFAFMFAVLVLKFSPEQAAATAIIGGADGPTAIFLANKLAKDMVGPIAVAAYSYMALVPFIQPPIMKLLTTKEERQIRMGQLREVKKIEKVIFPIVVAVVVILLLPSVASLIGMLMLGNLFKESGVVGRLSDTAQNALCNIITIFLGISVGATAKADVFVQFRTLGILVLGIVAFSISTAAGVLIGKLMCKLTKGKINPLIGAAGVSAVPMAARVAQKVGQEEDPGNFLLMNAMGPNVAGVIGTAVAAGILLKLFG
jgi:carboxybiotin decarboxylase